MLVIRDGLRESPVTEACKHHASHRPGVESLESRFLLNRVLPGHPLQAIRLGVLARLRGDAPDAPELGQR